MPKPKKTSDVIEEKSEIALEYVLVGGLAILIGLFLFHYRGSGMLLGLVTVLLIGGAISVYWGISRAWKVREVKGIPFVCSYCNKKNYLAEEPSDDFLCSYCNRAIPVQDGVVMPVYQVRCGYCNELNYYNARTEVLICEKCDHEIPIAQEEGKPQKHLPHGFVIQDDPNLYDLVLVEPGPKTEELIPALQQMLALTRPQVKQIMEELPAVLLTGITRKKAEMLQAQLAVHEAKAEYNPISE
jgi:hypothetical protein